MDVLPPGRSLLEHNLAVHAVEGVRPGLYRWRDGELELVSEGDVREAAKWMSLGQDLGGDGVLSAFHCADVASVTGALGSRGYRVAQLEAGVVEGRLHLAAFAAGLGATGLTFFDREVSRRFRTAASPMLETAIGKPAYRSRPGGSPRNPTSLN